MLARENLNFLGILSGLYGITNLLLPWGIAELRGYVQPLSLWFEGWFDFASTYVRSPLPYYTLTHISAILAITIAIMILGCFTAFLGGFTTGRKEKMLIFSAGISFSLAPLLFLTSLQLLFSGFGITFFGYRPGYSGVRVFRFYYGVRGCGSRFSVSG